MSPVSPIFLINNVAKCNQIANVINLEIFILEIFWCTIQLHCVNIRIVFDLQFDGGFIVAQKFTYLTLEK